MHIGLGLYGKLGSVGAVANLSTVTVTVTVTKVRFKMRDTNCKI